MKYFIDFEASEARQMIISIGCVCEDGREFYSLVHTDDPITERIEELTRISQQEIDEAPEQSEVFERFWDWCSMDEGLPEFICYGDGDFSFVDNALAEASTFREAAMLSYIYMNMFDCSKDIRDFFYVNKTISLEKLGKHFFKDMDDQNHNALDDAKLLRTVYGKMKSGSRDFSDFKEYVDPDRYPDMARKVLRLNGDQVLQEFGNMTEAEAWVKSQSKDAKYVNNAAEKIKKAAREGSKYCGANWRIL